MALGTERKRRVKEVLEIMNLGKWNEFAALKRNREIWKRSRLGEKIMNFILDMLNLRRLQYIKANKQQTADGAELEVKVKTKRLRAGYMDFGITCIETIPWELMISPRWKFVDGKEKKYHIVHL